MFSSVARCSIGLTAFALASFAVATPAETPAIRFDGLYHAAVQPPPGWRLKPTQRLFLYCRFYPNGSVVTVLSTAAPTKVATFLRPYVELSGNGTYSVSGDRVHFRVAVRHGYIDYSGKIRGDSLELRSYGEISVRRYKFVPVRFSKSTSNKSMKPTAHWRNNSSVFVATPCRGLSPSR